MFLVSMKELIPKHWRKLAGAPSGDDKAYAEAETEAHPNAVNVPVEATPDAINDKRIIEIRRNLRRVARMHPGKIASVWLNTAVYVAGPTAITDDGVPVQIDESNEDEWVPTNDWKVRRLYRSVAVPSSPENILTAFGHVLAEAADHQNNTRCIYIVSAAVVWFDFGQATTT